MPYIAASAFINKVENGFLINLSTFGSSVSLVAKTQEEALALLAEVEFKVPAYSLDSPNTLSGQAAGLPSAYNR